MPGSEEGRPSNSCQNFRSAGRTRQNYLELLMHAWLFSAPHPSSDTSTKTWNSTRHLCHVRNCSMKLQPDLRISCCGREGKRKPGRHCGRTQRKAPQHKVGPDISVTGCCSAEINQWPIHPSGLWIFYYHVLHAGGQRRFCFPWQIHRKGKNCNLWAFASCPVARWSLVASLLLRWNIEPILRRRRSQGARNAITFNLYSFVFILKMNRCYITGEKKEAC